MRPILFIVILLPSALAAQFSRYPVYMPQQQSGNMVIRSNSRALPLGPKADSILKAHGVKEVGIHGISYDLDKSEKVSGKDSQHLVFNAEGKLLREQNFDFKRNGRIVPGFGKTYSYDSEGRITEYTWGKAGSMNPQGFVYRYRYDARGRVIASEGLRLKDRRLEYRTTNTYDSSGRLLLRRTENGKREISRTEYEYQPDARLASTRSYRNGKLKETQFFSCDPRGEEVNKSTVFVCREKRDLGNGMRLEISQTDDPRNPEKQITCYDSLNRLLYMEIFKQGNSTAYYGYYRSFGPQGMLERNVKRYGKQMSDSAETLVLYSAEGGHQLETRTFESRKGKREQLQEIRRSYANGLPDRSEEMYFNTGRKRLLTYRYL
jgi:hypothetical protein